MSRDSPQVSAHPVAAGKHYQVSWYQLSRVDLTMLLAADHRDTTRHDRPESFPGSLSAVLLGKGEDPIEDDDPEYRQAKLRKAGDECQSPGDPEHHGEKMKELSRELQPNPGPLDYG
jgi:hypothetical protein